MFPLFILIAASTGVPDCGRFAARAGEPVRVQIDQLSAAQVSHEAVPLPKEHAWETQSFRVGRFIYQGDGHAYRSADERFNAVRASVLDQTRALCRYGVELPSGYDSSKGTYVREGLVTFSPLNVPTQRPPGLETMERAGARPSLEGYTLVSSWPDYAAGKQFLIALMQPDGHALPKTTIVVASSMEKGLAPAIVLARLEGEYLGLSILPNLHGPGAGVSLLGRDEGGSLRTVVLRISGDVEQQLASEVGSSMK